MPVPSAIGTHTLMSAFVLLISALPALPTDAATSALAPPAATTPTAMPPVLDVSAPPSRFFGNGVFTRGLHLGLGQQFSWLVGSPIGWGADVRLGLHDRAALSASLDMLLGDGATGGLAVLGLAVRLYSVGPLTLGLGAAGVLSLVRHHSTTVQASGGTEEESCKYSWTLEGGNKRTCETVHIDDPGSAMQDTALRTRGRLRTSVGVSFEPIRLPVYARLDWQQFTHIVGGSTAGQVDFGLALEVGHSRQNSGRPSLQPWVQGRLDWPDPGDMTWAVVVGLAVHESSAPGRGSRAVASGASDGEWMAVYLQSKATLTTDVGVWAPTGGRRTTEQCLGAGVCAHFGDCEAVQGVCRATRDEHCSRSVLCRAYGHCQRIHGACIAGTSHACAASLGCRVEGACALRDGRCTWSTSADCARSPWCARHGLCMWSQGRCLAGDDRHCAASKRCASHGECTAKQGGCVIGGPADCARTDLCRVYGLCGFASGRCLALRDEHCRASEGCRTQAACTAHQGRCTQGTSGDCASWPGCTLWGTCTLREGLCVAAGPQDCQGSQRCRDHGECIHSGDLCYPDLCRARFECRYEGRCTWRDGGCKAVRDDQCTASRMCRLDGRCTRKDGRCVHGSALDCARSSLCREQGRCHWREGHCARAP